ncbi:SusC/RagA family TonB-linked outer membrane protein [Echinicola strongylocentroti]|uniref:SusC/RagA family TonB-linked outer membrane protein n=1 Tax=Echinicola strongylocentroti TaxID=1795355 RepID=A0A2Z4IGI9_9BACT|nr:TonB-dependent receptor [Echinicola strongylocentroti]AWW29706.1 SusC/RagA family TonB-linked outer membrane protein [Echinicola strongylocentroti]
MLKKPKKQPIGIGGKLLLSAFLSVMFVMMVSARTIPQEGNIELDLHDASAEQVFKALKSQSDFTFLYRSDLIQEIPKISIKVKKAKIENVLDQVLTPYNFSYEISDQTVVIRKQEPTQASSQAAKSEPLAISVEGKVIDETGEALPGVSILEKGTTNGTVTDIDGTYRIEVATEESVLIFSFIGMQTQEIQVGSQQKIDVELVSDTEALDEVIVIGYGTQKKSDLTGAVGSVGGKELNERPSASLSQNLSGRVQGVNVSVNSGRPGGRANIRIRGNTSVSIANDPLYVIDGVILNAGGLANGSTPIDYINPGDIASIEVLKDASATAIYGARGANGVILVTTKRGGKDGARISYEGNYSVGVLPRKIPLLNSEEFLATEDLAYQNAQKYDPIGWANGIYEDPKLKRTDPRLFDENGNPLYDTDWQEESFKPAFTQNHQLSVTGGNADGNYGLYLGYRDEDGLMAESWMKRYSTRFVFDSKVKDWVKIGGVLSYNDQKESQVDPLGGGGIVAMRQVLEELPIIPVRYPDGSWGGNEDYPGMEGGNNPIHVVNERKYLLNTQTLIGNVYANFFLAKGLELRSSVSANIINQRNDYYGGRDLNYIAKNQRGDAYVRNDRRNSWQFENYLTYDKQINDDHHLNAMLGLSWQHVDDFYSMARSQNFQDDYFQYNNLGAGANAIQPQSGTTAYGLNSYFSRINYSLKDKYLFTLTGRADGSSKFGEENRFAFFPSAAIAWRASDEQFLNASKLISNLKFRASIGQTGNSEITAYQALAGMGSYAVIFDNQREIGQGVGRLANPDLKWEKTTQVDFGVELGLIQNRFMLELDLYRKITEDMLLSAPVPSSSGYTVVSQNVGSMENKGIEIGLNTVNIEKENFSWSTTFNISINKNKVTELAGGSDIFLGSTIVRKGEPVGSFFGFVHEGTWDTDEASVAAEYNKLPGDIKYRDVNEDGEINDADRVIIGKGIPDGFGTFANTFRYKGFELLVDIQYSYGNDVLFRSKHSAEDRTGIANSFRTVLNAWTPENQNTNVAQIRPLVAGYNTNNDSDRVREASFIRGRNLLLAYNFNGDLLERLNLYNLRAFVSVQNFFLSTEYEGYDPEVSTSGAAFDQGVDLYAYPKPRVFMLGVNVTL